MYTVQERTIPKMTAQEKLYKSIEEGQHVCIGLDTDINKIPSFLLSNEDPVFQFNKIIIDNTIEYAAAYKLNFAFYEKEGLKGIQSLKKTIEYINDSVLVIGDAKRGDIGNTSEMYAHALYNYFKVDAATVNPYMGYDSVSPFLKYSDKINFILALTSNPGADDFEKLILDDHYYVYQKVIDKVNKWNINDNCGIVFGATQLNELMSNIISLSDIPILLPGVGAQGASLEEVVSTFHKNRISKYLINSSRGIIYKNNSENFGLAARNELMNLNNIIKKGL